MIQKKSVNSPYLHYTLTISELHKEADSLYIIIFSLTLGAYLFLVFRAETVGKCYKIHSCNLHSQYILYIVYHQVHLHSSYT